ncbi:hypothetical protein CKF54_06695 [Psittacicella hinzii]|uniref:Calcineurin-like phosphoesterase domain-containing protein n=1 Tax=Psittacicella hinzii TaxID=2028575 RepID=A0A3A1Y2I2_9GAMM|nr:hypothetical protein [Psittacicella hinzii]RIY31428.1 hypothetical protein CKF54_06695 [Psittacicella hinzii]
MDNYTLPFLTRIEGDDLTLYNFFVSDLHLDASTNELEQLFTNFVDKLTQLAIDHRLQAHIRLFILGDFLALGIGDFIPDWFKPIQAKLLAFKEAGGEIFFMVGNRDFLLGKKFCKAIGAIYLPENTLIDFSINQEGDKATLATFTQLDPQVATLSNYTFTNRDSLLNELRYKSKTLDQAQDPEGLRLWLCHGDNLCLADEAYQRYRRVVRSGFVRFIEKIIPTFLVKAIANRISQASKAKRKQQEELLTATINANNSSNSASLSNQEQASLGQASTLDMADIELNYTAYLAHMSQANLMIYGHIHRQRMLNWSQAYGQRAPQIHSYQNIHEFIDFGNLAKMRDREAYSEVDSLYPIPVGKIRTFTASNNLRGVKEQEQALTTWDKLQLLNQDFFVLDPQENNSSFYGISMADWLSQADLDKQQARQEQALRAWQETAQDDLEQESAQATCPKSKSATTSQASSQTNAQASSQTNPPEVASAQNTGASANAGSGVTTGADTNANASTGTNTQEPLRVQTCNPQDLQERMEKAIALCTQPQSRASVALLVQEAFKEGKAINRFTFAFIDPENL